MQGFGVLTIGGRHRSEDLVNIINLESPFITKPTTKRCQRRAPGETQLNTVREMASSVSNS